MSNKKCIHPVKFFFPVLIFLFFISCDQSESEYGEYQVNYSYLQQDSTFDNDDWEVIETEGDTTMATQINNSNEDGALQLKFFFKSFITFVTAKESGEVYSFSQVSENDGSGQIESISGDLWFANDSIYLDYEYKKEDINNEDVTFLFITGKGSKIE